MLLCIGAKGRDNMAHTSTVSLHRAAYNIPSSL